MTQRKPISVIICAHNPRTAYLQRVLDALRAQTLAVAQWELLLIDNASADRIEGSYDLAWHPGGRHIREEELGLTRARLRGIKDSTGELIIFADDDNVLAPDYVEQAGRLAHAHPHIGAFGGSVAAEFEAPPPDWVKPYVQGLAVSEIDRDYWSNLMVFSLATPYGAGICVRRAVAEDYASKAKSSPARKSLGRIGTGLGAGEDTDMAWCAIDLGMGTARFKALKVKHLIPNSRLTESYIVKLNAGFSSAIEVLAFIRFGEKKAPADGLKEPLRFLWSCARTSGIQRRILIASWRATQETRKRIAAASLG